MKRILALAGIVAAGVAAYVLLRTPQRSQPAGPEPGSSGRDSAAGSADRVTPDAAPVPYQRRPLGRDGDG
ncbi:MAG: hypothetical protein K8M05_39320, partial [Deltaproteobacteria bacterium]|nr:hypothetical protein [Kofleriaceae bacterium]